MSKQTNFQRCGYDHTNSKKGKTIKEKSKNLTPSQHSFNQVEYIIEPSLLHYWKEH